MSLVHFDARLDGMGFRVISCVDVDEPGVPVIIERLRAQVADRPVYLSIDIDVLDPAFAPATGTPGTAGLNSRELMRLRGIAGANLAYELVSLCALGA